MAARRKAWGSWGAIFAAYLLVVQAALAGLALGAQAAEPAFGPLGQILCSGGPIPLDGAPTPSQHKSTPDCCAPGCPMLGGGMAPPAAASPAAVPTVETVTERLSSADAPVNSSRAWASKRPRGPPSAV
ncbi:hypothetical protein [Hansschlegelia zhihuaiae]|uniref:DUF2946 domain-containing protein n=1 Tax=Hansschlegelia zhihuaiae TaxID=405005 RepID=A0A4Q0MHQ1_9HYPH|nr:hypothetical protein [Hansschlegelia zhihuaiae]RXF72833.1 hypothetical protein EK403_13455 [Hansschlegelia zhihuaiae]